MRQIEAQRGGNGIVMSADGPPGVFLPRLAASYLAASAEQGQSCCGIPEFGAPGIPSANAQPTMSRLNMLRSTNYPLA